MSAAKPALQEERSAVAPLEAGRHAVANSLPVIGPRLVGQSQVRQFPQPRKDTNFQPRAPVIIGEAIYRGLMPVDGVITGHLGPTGGTMTVKQRPRTAQAEGVPELQGELTFKDMLRVQGHVSGKIFSNK